MGYAKGPSLRRVAASLLVVAVGVGLPTLVFAYHDFPDVDDAAFYHDDVHWLKENRITLGCAGGNYCPDDEVTRGEMASFLHRTADMRETPGFSVSVIDGRPVGEPAGSWTSIALGVDGRALISYFDLYSHDLNVAHCSNVACTAATLSTVDGVGEVGSGTSIAIGADGLGLISYHDRANQDLKVAHCSDVACTSATVTTLDSAGELAWTSSIAIGVDGLGIISYIDGYPNNDLKVAHCLNVSCTAATFSTLDGLADVGHASRIAIGADGLGLISYWDQTNLDLKVAHCSNVACSTATVTRLDDAGGVGVNTDVTVGSDGLGLISYHAFGFLRVAHCSNIECTTATTSTIDTGDVGHFSSITIGADGLGLISHRNHGYNVGGSLKVAHCTSIMCDSVTSITADSGIHVASTISSMVGVDGKPIISYHDPRNWSLKVMHCSNWFCVANHRGR